jgi:hypothetical protein
LTEHQRTNAKIVAKEVEEELVRREVELVRHAREENDSAIRRVKELEGQLAKAISTISKLREEAKIATKDRDKPKEVWDGYRHDQLAVAQSLQWGTRLDADNDSPIRGAYDDPEASHVAALREIDRLHGVIKNQATTHYTNMQIATRKNTILRRENTRLICVMRYIEKNPGVLTLSRNLSNLTLTEKEGTANQTDAFDQDKPYYLGDGSVLLSAERHKKADIDKQHYRKLLQTDSSYRKRLKELEVAKASEQARVEILEKELNLTHRKYLKALEHIQSLQPSAGALQQTVCDANTAFEEVMETYQDPTKHMKLVTLLAPGCNLEENLILSQISADTVVGGLKKTDAGMEFAKEVAAVHQLLDLQNQKSSREGSGVIAT